MYPYIGLPPLRTPHARRSVANRLKIFTGGTKSNKSNNSGCHQPEIWLDQYHSCRGGYCIHPGISSSNLHCSLNHFPRRGGITPPLTQTLGRIIPSYTIVKSASANSLSWIILLRCSVSTRIRSWPVEYLLGPSQRSPASAVSLWASSRVWTSKEDSLESTSSFATIKGKFPLETA